MIPPEADAEFAASMEEVLDTCEKPYNPTIPVLCMDEQPVQLIKETKTPFEPTLDHGKRVDYEYERAGSANIFMSTEPLSDWREVAVRERKTKIDWAIEMARLLEGRYADCEKVIVVCDIETLRDETTAWSTNVNTLQRGVDWQMKIEDARCKQKTVYPKVKL